MKIDLLEPTNTDEVRLELVPLIDVIFCILTFFILAAVGLTQQQAIDLDLPAAQTGQPLQGQPGQPLPERLYVSIDAFGQVYLDQQPVSIELLTDVLRQYQQAAPDGLIVLYASRDARYEDVVTVLDQLRAVGGDRVALATLPGEAQPGAAQPGAVQPGQPGLPGQPGDDLLPLQPAPDPLSPIDPNTPLSPFGDQSAPFNQPQSPLNQPQSPANPGAQPGSPLAPGN